MAAALTSTCIMGGSNAWSVGDKHLPAEKAIIDTNWATDNFSPAGKDRKKLTTMRITADNHISGKTTCNNYMGSVKKLTANQITISQLASTLKMCLDKADMKGESEFLNKFSNKTLNYKITGNRLVIDGTIFLKMDR